MKKIVDANNRKIDPRRVLYFFPDCENKKRIIRYGYFDDIVPSENNGVLDTATLKKGKQNDSIIQSVFLGDTRFSFLKKMPKIFSIDIFIEGTNLKATYCGGAKRVDSKLKQFEEDIERILSIFYEYNLSNELSRKYAIFKAKHPDWNKEVEELNKEERELMGFVDSFIEKNLPRYKEEIKTRETDFTEAIYSIKTLISEFKKMEEDNAEEAISAFFNGFINLASKVNQPLDEGLKLKIKEFIEKAKQHFKDYYEIKEVQKQSEELSERNKGREQSKKIRINYENGSSIVVDYEQYINIFNTKINQDELKTKKIKKFLKTDRALRIAIIVITSIEVLISLFPKILDIKLQKTSENIEDLPFVPKTVYVSKSSEAYNLGDYEATYQKTETGGYIIGDSEYDFLEEPEIKKK